METPEKIRDFLKEHTWIWSFLFGIPLGWAAAYLIFTPRIDLVKDQESILEKSNESLETELATLSERVEACEMQRTYAQSMSKIIESFGEDFKSYRRWQPFDNIHESLFFGDCGESPCASVHFKGVSGAGPEAVFEFLIRGPTGSFIARIPLRKGCSRTALTSYDQMVLVAVEDDSYQNPSLGIAVKARPPERKDPARPRDWSRNMPFVTPAGRIDCPDNVIVCREATRFEATVDPVACLSPVGDLTNN